MIGLNVWVGGSHGFSRSLFETVALIGGICAGFLLAPYGAAYVPFPASLNAKMVFAGVIIGVLTMILINTIGWWVRKGVIIGPMKLLDRLAGAILGFVKGSVFVIALVMVLLMTPFGKRLEAGAEKSNSYPLRWSIAAAKPAGAWLGGWIGGIINNQISKAMPATVGTLTEQEVSTLLVASDSLKRRGMSPNQVISALLHTPGGGAGTRDTAIIREIVSKSDLIRTEGLKHEQIAKALTTNKLPVSSGSIREVIGALQSIQAEGLPLQKDILYASLSPTARQEVEDVMVTIKVRSLDPETFARETGLDLDEIIRDYGLEPLYQQYRQKQP